MAGFLAKHAAALELEPVLETGGMMALVNVEETLESMIPEWENRLSISRAADLRVEFTLVVDRVPFRIRANKGAIDVARCSGTNKVSLHRAGLLHMITGYRGADEILFSEHRLLTAAARETIALLFPKRAPYVWPLDRF